MRKFLAVFLVSLMVLLMVSPLFVISNSNASESIEIPAPVATVTVFIPGPVDTVTQRIPGPTVFLPQPTATVTRIIPGDNATRTIIVTRTAPTRTVTEESTATSRSTVSSNSTATETATESPESTPTRTEKGQVNQGPLVKFWEREVPVPVVAGIGIVSFVAAILALYLGYVLGFEDKARDERKFLRSLSDQFIRRGKHE